MKFTTFGADPEFFVLDPKGKAYPATNFSKGTKDNPHPIGNGFYEQRDNVSFEGNIPSACSKEEFITNVTHLRQYFIKKVSKFGYSISTKGVEYFDKRFLQLPEAKEFGCSSVISSWDSSVEGIVERPTPSLDNCDYRVSGFHIHIGYEGLLFKNKLYTDILIGRLFDLFLTIPTQEINPEPERLKTYGKFGMIRSKSYGVECRTVSTTFTQEQHLPFIWDQLMKIEDFINNSSEKDLTLLINSHYYISSDINNMKRIIYGILNTFTDKTILTKFNETKNIHNETIKKSEPIEYIDSNWTTSTASSW